MSLNYLYHYKKPAPSRVKLFVVLAILFLLVSAIPYILKSIIDIPDIFFISTTVFIVISTILFFLAWQSHNNPALYEAIVTQSKLIIKYPKNDSLSFEVKINNIKAVGNRPINSMIGKENQKAGLVLKNGYFYHVCTKYGNDIETIFTVIKSINPNIIFKANDL